ncbi:MAG: CbtB domain-containing protein [Paracoccaceae bacterium]|nr:CbtB domain-containing protein [Paracoccaceae bacterium]
MNTTTNTTTQAQTASNTDLLTIALVAFMGLGLVFITGFAHVPVLHDSAHDVRHSIGFACH